MFNGGKIVATCEKARPQDLYIESEVFETETLLSAVSILAIRAKFGYQKQN